MKSLIRYVIIALLAEIAGLVIIFSIAHLSSHDLSSALKQRLTAYDLRFSKNPVNCVKYNADRVEAARSIAELSNLSEALDHGTGFLLAFPIVSVLAAFSLDVRKKEQIKKVKQIEKGQDNEFVFFEETSKLLFFFCFSLPVLLLAGCCVLGKSWTQETILWICRQSLSIVLCCFPITALILLALLFVKDRAPMKFKWSYMLAFVPLVRRFLEFRVTDAVVCFRWKRLQRSNFRSHFLVVLSARSSSTLRLQRATGFSAWSY